jgi:hypothetical protein
MTAREQEAGEQDSGEQESGPWAVAVYTTADGGSALARMPLPLARKTTAPDGTTVWDTIGGAGSWGVLSGSQPGLGAWHVSAKAGISILLAGSWEIETTNGQRARFDVGDALVMLDTTGRGHRANTLAVPCSVIGLSFDAATHQRIIAQLAAITGVTPA